MRALPLDLTVRCLTVRCPTVRNLCVRFSIARYFTAPNVSPCTSCFWLNQPNTTIGAIAISDAADNLAQNSPSELEYDAIKVASVPARAELRLSDQNASFHENTRHNNPVEASPPMPSGRITCRNSLHTLAPSMRAASRISCGMSLKYEYSIHTMIGRFDSMKMTVSAVRVS